jgi:DNA repair protein RadC
MTRERRNAPEPTHGERVRRRLVQQPELELTDEELLALADEGIDPDDVRRVARERPDALEASDHDRDTARDDLEGLEGLASESADDY